MKHVKLDTSRLDGWAKKAADTTYVAGGSPRRQLEAARDASGRPLVYLPHQGAKERAKRVARMKAGK